MTHQIGNDMTRIGRIELTEYTLPFKVKLGERMEINGALYEVVNAETNELKRIDEKLEALRRDANHWHGIARAAPLSPVNGAVRTIDALLAYIDELQKGK